MLFALSDTMTAAKERALRVGVWVVYEQVAAWSACGDREIHDMQ